ncbi:MAG: hypothetical protein AAFN17_00475, partial [Pseudomonadota bacterium]
VTAASAIDIRIASPEVDAIQKEREKRRAKRVRKGTRTAVEQLLHELGEGLTDELRNDIRRAAETVDPPDRAEGDDQGEAEDAERDTYLLLGHRVASLYGLSRASADRIAAIAERTGRSVDEIDRLITLLKGAEAWGEVLTRILVIVM